jgi:DNA-binding CsgD family transcriptional regulator
MLRPDHSASTEVATSDLIERATELGVLSAAVRRLAGGEGGVVVLEAPAGLGKTALLERTVEMANDAGCLVRRTAAGPLERHFPFAVLRALLEAPLRDASDEERAELLEGAASAAGVLLLDGTMPGGDATMMVAHSTLWLCSALAERQPLVIMVDDVQWCDRASLEVLSYIARRVEDLPLLIVLGARADAAEANGLVGLIGGLTAASMLHPQPLTASGAVKLIRRVVPDVSFAVCADCHRATGGNPWLIGELARQIAAHGPEVIHYCRDEATPVSTIARNVVRRRMAPLSLTDRAVAGALAVLGDGAAQHVVASVAQVPLGELGEARDALVNAGLLDAGGERFAHGLIAAAISEDLTRHERERLHREAARALMTSGAETDVIASHLVQCAPQGDGDVSGLLVKAALDAAGRGAPHTAAAYLQRALDERAPGDDRSWMLSRMATLAFDAGLPDSRRRLREALSEVRDRDGRIDVLTRLAAAQVVDMADGELTGILERELVDEADPDTRLAVEAAALDTLMMIPERHTERARRAAAADIDGADNPLVARAILAHRAWLATEVGTPDAKACASLAQEALEGDLLLHDAARRAAYHLCIRALVMSEDVEAARAEIEHLNEHAINRGSLGLRATASWYSAELEIRLGNVADAENHARMVLDLIGDSMNMVTGGAIEVLVRALAERGAFEEARELLADHRLDGDLGELLWEIGIRDARARLYLAEGDFEAAYGEACAVGALRDKQGRPNPAWTGWRSTAALALAYLGRRDEAVALADAELVLAEHFGAPTPIITALHARAVAETDDDTRVLLCERALAIADGLELPLLAARVRRELGITLTRMGRRLDGREVLRPALAEADAIGAVMLARDVRRDLVATGVRPRRAATEGVASLTPRQRQVCDLAAGGKGNREIAQQLFLSVKTVETHLAACFQKLGVDTRLELSDKLAA